LTRVVSSHPRTLSTILAATALVGALAGAASLAIAVRVNPVVMLELDREEPRILSGFYDMERYQDETFAWTTARAGIRLPALDRRIPWRCSVRLRGPRPPGSPHPSVELSADGVVLATVTATDPYQDVDIAVPARPARQGVHLTIASSNTFVPGPEDTRELGLRIDRVACRPAERHALPPLRAMAAAAIAGAVFGAAFGLVAQTLWIALGSTLLVAVAQAVPLSTGFALYTEYHASIPWLAIGIAIPVILGMWGIERWRQQRFDAPTRFVMGYSTSALYLLLLALLHPAKALVDAVFHAHRLEWVLGGRYYFTQPMPDGVSFPYAIGLYLFSAPFAAFGHDHVALLRIVVVTWQVLAGALLYPMVVRSSGDRLAGAIAVVLFSLVPISYMVVGNANLTNAFGHSAALVTMSAATLWGLGSRKIGQLAGLFLLASLAFLSHVSTFPLLLMALVACAALFRWLGGAPLRAPARSILLATIAVALFSVTAYYGHFGDVYKALDRVRARPAATVPGAQPPAGAAAQRDGQTAGVQGAPALATRAASAVARSVRAVGWPIAVLALLGAWRLWADGIRTRLGFAILAWGVVYVAFLALGVVAPVGATHYRYAVEFIDRVTYATFPAAVVLAALGAAWAWRAGMWLRIGAVALLIVAVLIGVRQWLGWLQ
jgi:hypothetical protein